MDEPVPPPIQSTRPLDSPALPDWYLNPYQSNESPPLPLTKPQRYPSIMAPAVGLIVVALLGYVNVVFTLHDAWQHLHEQPTFNYQIETEINVSLASLNVTFSLLWLISSSVILVGGISMFRLQNFPVAATAAVMSVVPCFSPALAIGLPVGVWSLFVLFSRNCRGAFH